MKIGTERGTLREVNNGGEVIAQTLFGLCREVECTGFGGIGLEQSGTYVALLFPFFKFTKRLRPKQVQFLIVGVSRTKYFEQGKGGIVLIHV